MIAVLEAAERGGETVRAFNPICYMCVQRSRENHFLDCEAMAYAAAYMLWERGAHAAWRQEHGT